MPVGTVPESTGTGLGAVCTGATCQIVLIGFKDFSNAIFGLTISGVTFGAEADISFLATSERLAMSFFLLIQKLGAKSIGACFAGANGGIIWDIII